MRMLKLESKIAGALAVASLFLIVTPVAARPGAEGDERLLPLNIKLGEKAPDFGLPAADGKTVRLSDFAGHNVLIDFYRGYW